MMEHRPPDLGISIVTPSFNQATFIEEALWSVRDQNYPSTEHWVIDGGSTDGTVEILKRYRSRPGWEHLRWVSERDRGQSDALNKGFRMATGDIIGWLNSDDRYRPGCFQSVLDGFHRHRNADVLYGDYTWIDVNGRVTCIRREIEFSKFILAYHRVLYIPTPSTFFRRRIFADGNFIDMQFHYAMDYDFFLRLANRGYRFRHIPQLLADFRWHQNSKTGSQSERQFAEYDRIALNNSRLLQVVPEDAARKVAFFVLRKVAGTRRYAEKFVRGYYFKEFHRRRLLRGMK
jgi:glycosyltransferase involved in cell wall biosynthesis